MDHSSNLFSLTRNEKTRHEYQLNLLLFQTGYEDLNRSSRNLLVCLVEINDLLHDLGLAASSSPSPSCCSPLPAGNTSSEESNKLDRVVEAIDAPEDVELDVLSEQDEALVRPLHVVSALDQPHCMADKKYAGAGCATRDGVELKVPGIPHRPLDGEALVQHLQVLSALDEDPTPAREPQADREPVAEPDLPDLVPGGVSPVPCLAALADFCPGQSLLPDLVTSSSLYTNSIAPYPDIVTSHVSNRAGHDSQFGHRTSQDTNRRSNVTYVNTRRSNLLEVNRRSNLAEVNRRSNLEELNGKRSNFVEWNMRSNLLEVNNRRLNLAEENRGSDLAEIERRVNLTEMNRRSNLEDVNRRSNPAELNRKSKPAEVNRRSNLAEVNRRSHLREVNRRSNLAEVNRWSNLEDVNRRSNPAELKRRSNPAELNRRSNPAEVNRRSNLPEVNRRSNPMAANLHPAWSEAGRRLKDIADGLELVTSPTMEDEEEVDSRLISRLEAVVGQPRSSLNMFADISVSLLFNLALYVAVKKLQTVI